jgi:hypothetical protein
MPALLDELAAELVRTANRRTVIYHSFVAVAPPPRPDRQGILSPAVENPASGIVVAVLVDRETKDESLAVILGGELAAAAERWALLSR